MALGRCGARLAIASVIVTSLHAAPVHADVFTTNWDVVPHEDVELSGVDSDYYRCSGDVYLGRTCSWLWDKGLELTSEEALYDDTWLEANGPGIAYHISAECRTGLQPCFDGFKPLKLTLSAGSHPSPLGISLTSSRGGYKQVAPRDQNSGPFTFYFHGARWQDVEWIDIGFFYPERHCQEYEYFCTPYGERHIILDELTFRAGPEVPEPSLMALLAIGAAGLSRRQRRTGRSQHG